MGECVNFLFETFGDEVGEFHEKMPIPQKAVYFAV